VQRHQDGECAERVHVCIKLAQRSTRVQDRNALGDCLRLTFTVHKEYLEGKADAISSISSIYLGLFRRPQ